MNSAGTYNIATSLADITLRQQAVLVPLRDD